jgi:hypothetical protein
MVFRKALDNTSSSWYTEYKAHRFFHRGGRTQYNLFVELPKAFLPPQACCFRLFWWRKGVVDRPSAALCYAELARVGERRTAQPKNGTTP